MMTTRPRGGKGTKHRYDRGDKHDHNDKRRKGHNSNKPGFRKAYRGTDVEENLDPEEDQRKHDEKLLKELSHSLAECSRQRLRAVHMSFRQYGNDQSKMSSKEMSQSFQDNGISIPNRTLKPLSKKFEGTTGIDLEGLYKFLTEAHARTGRDSVLAMYKRNDLERRHDVSQDEIDEDFLWRIESQLIKSHEYVDIQALRTEVQRIDSSESGRIDSNVLKQTCTDMQIPVFGALLKNLMKRCDEQQNGKVSWPEFIFFLERAQENAWKSCPSLKELPEKQRNKTPVAPSPLDELSTRARTTIVNKLRKKTSVKKTEPPDLSGDPATEDTQQKTNQGEPDTRQTNAKSDTKSEISPKEQNVNKNEKENGTEKIEQQENRQNNGISKAKKTDSPKEQVVSNDKSEENEKVTSEKKSKNSEKKSLLRRETPIDIMIHEPSEHQIKTKHHETENNNTNPKCEQKTDGECDKTEPATTEYQEANVGGQCVKENSENAPEKENVDINESQSKAHNEVPASPLQPNSAALDQTTISINVRGKILEFQADKEYLRRQTIDPPRERLRLNWVYGYRGNDCRANIHVLGSQELVYFIAHIAVLYHPGLHRQRHYKEHTEEIKCIDVHSNRLYVATGQYASRKNLNIKAHVRVWRSDNLHTLHVLGTDVFEKSVACLAFSPGKDLLAAVDNCLEKKLSVWDSETGDLLGQELLHTDLVCDVTFSTKDPDVVVTVGKEHLCWWKVYPDNEKIQASSNPDYETFLRAKFVICLTNNDRGDLVTGDSNGTIYVFGDGGNKITNFVKHAHDGPVFTVVFYKGHILSGGRDGIIHCWQYNKNMDATGFIQIPKSEGGVRMLTIQDNHLYIGTTMNSMLVAVLSEGESPVNGATLDIVPLTQCHYDDLRGLTGINNNSADILSAGLDGIVCGFNTTLRKCVSKYQMKGNQYISIDAADSGNLLVLGTKDGHLHLLQASYVDDRSEWTEIFNRKLCKDRMDIVKFSPDGLWIGAGSHDHHVYIMSFMIHEEGPPSWEYTGKLEGHTSYITGLDWSTNRTLDGFVLRTSSASLELKYWLPESISPLPVPLLPDVQWASNTILVDVTVAGILATKCCLDTEAVTMASNPSRTLLVLGDNSGGLSLFRYPSSLKGVFCHGYKSHAVVYRAIFSPSGNYVISVGGRDSCIMQWEVV